MALNLSNYLNKLSTSVTIRVQPTSYNDYGDISGSYSEHTTTAIIEENASDMIFAPEGEVVVGDIIAIFDPADESYLDEHNTVVINSVEYKILDVYPQNFGSETAFYVVSLKKV